MKHVLNPLGRAIALAAPLWLVACSKAPEAAAPAPAAPASAAAQAHAGIDWVKPDGASVEAIFAKAKADNKPVFLYWGAVWCPPCNQIKATVFNRPDFIAKSKAFVPVYLDGDTPGAQKLGTQFKVRGYPTTILFKPDGTELTRLPGEVDAVQYMQLLTMGLASTQPIKETLTQALAKDAAAPALTADAWRMLAFYSWEIDEGQLVPKKELASTLQQLAQKCPPELKDSAARLMLKATAVAAQEKSAGPDKAQVLAAAQSVLADAARARENADIVAYYGNDIIALVTAKGSAERTSLLTAWNAALDRLAVDATLSKADQLGAAQAKVTLTEIDGPADPKAPRDAALVAMARDAATKADTDQHRQIRAPSRHSQRGAFAQRCGSDRRVRRDAEGRATQGGFTLLPHAGVGIECQEARRHCRRAGLDREGLRRLDWPGYSHAVGQWLCGQAGGNVAQGQRTH